MVMEEFHRLSLRSRLRESRQRSDASSLRDRVKIKGGSKRKGLWRRCDGYGTIRVIERCPLLAVPIAVAWQERASV
jgi:hypothetical protein